MSLRGRAVNFPARPLRQEAPASPVALAAGTRRASDGSMLWWGDGDTPVPPELITPGASVSVTVAVSPIRPGHSVAVEHRVNSGPIRQANQIWILDRIGGFIHIKVE
jgi:hypothetical protein